MVKASLENIRQQYQYIWVWALSYSQLGLQAEGTGFGDGLYFIWNIILLLVLLHD